MAKKRTLKLTTTQLILLSFLFTIVIGSVLLYLPISSASGKSVSYIDALFTSTTSVCVTGLVTLPTVTAWSPFGHAVILCLIQIGGLGIITVMSMLMILLQKKMGLSDRILLQDAFNLNSISGVVKFVKKVIKGTFIVEGIGALLYMCVFVPDFGIKGIWISVFNSISAFCNAGIDIISENSLCDYATNPLVNAVTCMLIILGGLGFVVWWDVIKTFKRFGKHKGRCIRALSLHSKIALSMTAFLIVLGAVMFLAFEYNNPETMKGYSAFDKIQLSLFQSVTTRTAGFATIPQQNLTDASSLVSLLLMFIGGSPVGTAGGIKTVTLAVLLATARSTVKNKNEINIFGRTLSKQAVGKAVGVVCMSFVTVFVSTLLLSAVSGFALLDVMYESVSAAATVGLSRNLTPMLDFWGKIIIIVTMYFGRVGPISFAVLFGLKRKNENIIKNPTEDVRVG
ncbi:MAG: potassium transporter KtrB [Clostridia bacterium]|nr:potassium transporter KtrB [Clostridia bacterium]